MSEADEKSILVECGVCQARMRVPASAAGRQAKCPKCGTLFRVPVAGPTLKASATAPAGSAATEPVRFECPACGTRIKVPRKAIGRRVKCPSCAAVLTVPAQRQESVSAAAREDSVSADDEDDGLLSDLAAAERSAASLGEPDLAAMAAAPRPAGIGAPSAPPGAAGGKARAVAGAAGAALGGVGRFAGPMVLGCLLSGIAAVIGAAVWTLLAIATDRQFGLVALALGGLVGFAMALGLRRPSVLGGVVAAGFSVLSIIAAKVFIFAFVIYAVVTGDTGNIDLQRAYVVAHVTEEMLDERGVVTEEARDQHWETTWDEAETRVERMSDDEIRRRWEEYREVDAALAEETLAELEESQPGGTSEFTDAAYSDLGYDEEAEYEEAGAESGGEGLFLAFLIGVFGFRDVLFLGLAVVTAYVVGSRGTGSAQST